MTDGDEPNSERRNVQTDPRKHLTPRVFGAVKITAATTKRAANQADPTDPEVPTAKRLRVAKRKRSMFVLGCAVVGFLLLTLFLLYKTGRQVMSVRSLAGEGAAGTTKPDATSIGAAEHPSEAASVTPNTHIEGAPASLADPGTVSRAASTGIRGATPAPRAKSSAPASDIFRRPSF